MATEPPTNLASEFPPPPATAPAPVLAKHPTNAESEFPPASVPAPVLAKKPTNAESELPPTPALAPVPAPVKQSTNTESDFPSAPVPAKVETPVDFAPKPVNPSIVPATNAGDSKSSAVARGNLTETPIPMVKKDSKNSLDRDIALAKVEKEKKLSFVKAWEESQKAKAENRAQKELSAINSWENTKKADIEAMLKQFEEQMEKKKAEYAEKMKNTVALIHKQAEEKRALVEAKKGEELLKAEETAAKYRATGSIPKKSLGCFGG